MILSFFSYILLLLYVFEVSFLYYTLFMNRGYYFPYYTLIVNIVGSGLLLHYKAKQEL